MIYLLSNGMTDRPTCDLEKWQAHLRSRGHLGWRKVLRAIEDMRGRTLGEKRAYWAEQRPSFWRPFAGFLYNLNTVRGVLDEMIEADGRDAVVKSTRPLEPAAALRDAIAEAEDKATKAESLLAVIAVYERKRIESVAGLAKDSDEYNRRWAYWSRLIEDEMKR